MTPTIDLPMENELLFVLRDADGKVVKRDEVGAVATQEQNEIADFIFEAAKPTTANEPKITPDGASVAYNNAGCVICSPNLQWPQSFITIKLEDCEEAFVGVLKLTGNDDALLTPEQQAAKLTSVAENLNGVSSVEGGVAAFLCWKGQVFCDKSHYRNTKSYGKEHEGFVVAANKPQNSIRIEINSSEGSLQFSADDKPHPDVVIGMTGPLRVFVGTFSEREISNKFRIMQAYSIGLNPSQKLEAAENERIQEYAKEQGFFSVHELCTTFMVKGMTKADFNERLSGIVSLDGRSWAITRENITSEKNEVVFRLLQDAYENEQTCFGLVPGDVSLAELPRE